MESTGQEILFSSKFIPIIGRSHFYSNTVRIKSLEGVCLKRNNRGFSVTAMKMPVEVILPLKESYEGAAIRFLLAFPLQICLCYVPNLQSMTKTWEAYSS